MDNALVVAAYGKRLLVETPDHRLWPAFSRNRKLRPVCGDRVQCATAGDEAVVSAIAPRSSCLWRHDVRRGRRPVAANLDTLVVVSANRPATTAEQLDRYLALAALQGLDALLVLNKIDLPDAGQRRALAEYARLGYHMAAVSARDETGMAALAQALAGRHSALVGLSGVGKSSLINALIPDHAARTAALSAASGEGRHTTTAARLYPLQTQGWVIDSPGVRDIRLWPMPAAELARGFVEFRPYLGRCRFNDCRHQQEPDCAVRAAVAAGMIAQRRYASFTELAARLNDSGPTTGADAGR